MLRALVVLSDVSAAGCAASEAQVREAQTSGYKADFAIVYSEVLAAVRELYPHLNENASAGVIKTGWHAVRVRTGTTDESTDPTSAVSGNPAFQQGALGRKTYFIRFNVAVVGGDPWRVRVEGQASSWDIAGGVPEPMTGAEKPPWLDGRVAALQLAIHDRLKKYAVKLKFKDPAERGRAVAQTDNAKYGNVPQPAARVVSFVKQAALERNTTALRDLMVDDFSWGDGGEPSADVAIAMWQADATILGELASVLDAGCRADAAKTTVTCPPAFTDDPGYDGYRAGFKRFGDRWLLAFFNR
jgi:hypothetical protein